VAEDDFWKRDYGKALLDVRVAEYRQDKQARQIAQLRADKALAATGLPGMEQGVPMGLLGGQQGPGQAPPPQQPQQPGAPGVGAPSAQQLVGSIVGSSVAQGQPRMTPALSLRFPAAAGGHGQRRHAGGCVVPTQKQPVATLDRLAQTINDRVDTMAAGIAERLGPASGTDRYTQAEADDLWDTPDTSVDQNALFQALQQGITPEGAQAVGLLRMAPDLAQHVTGTPQPPDAAAAIAKLAEYPGRYVLTAGHSSDAAAQVAFVEQQHKRAARRRQQRADVGQTVPMAPTTPAPTAPGGGY
jgi:hypothetical protein